MSVVMPNFNGCRGDDNHVHLQVDVNNRVYDAVINVRSEFDLADRRVFMAEVPIDVLPGVPWSPGWHDGELASYVFDVGVSAAEFTPFEVDPLADEIVAAVLFAGPISVFMVGFDDGSGGHKVHKNNNGTDGLIVVDPTGTPTAIAFRFSDQSF